MIGIGDKLNLVGGMKSTNQVLLRYHEDELRKMSGAWLAKRTAKQNRIIDALVDLEVAISRLEQEI